MNFCPNCYGELTGSPGPRFKGFCPKCKQNVLMRADAEGTLKAKMNFFMGLNLSKEIKTLQKTVDSLLVMVQDLKAAQKLAPPWGARGTTEPLTEAAPPVFSKQDNRVGNVDDMSSYLPRQESQKTCNHCGDNLHPESEGPDQKQCPECNAHDAKQANQEDTK